MEKPVMRLDHCLHLTCVCLAFSLISINAAEARASGCTYPQGGIISPINPCDPGCTDLNFDGAVDICDDLLFVPDYYTNNLRSDFYADGHIDMSDLAVYAHCYTSSPSPVGTTGSGAVGVYFDAAGTITELDNVTFGTPVTIYVVAHGLPAATVDAIAFELELNNQMPSTFTEIPPAWLAGSYALSDNYADVGQCSHGIKDLCAPTSATMVLMQYDFIYLPLTTNHVNTIIGVRGIDGYQDPWPLPAYVACGSGCSITYIPLSAATSGRAIINPIDYNGNGLADSFEVQGTRWYNISGESTGDPWMVAIQEGGGGGWHDEAACGPLGLGAGAAEIVAELVAKIDAIEGDNAGPEAGLLSFSTTTFWVSAPGGTDFELGVGPDTASYPDDYCWSPPSNFCEFNPILREVLSPTASVPIAGSFNLNNYPNPFNPGTTIVFDLPQAARTDLAVYDLRGGLVRTLITGQPLDAGRREAAWDGRDEQGNAVAAGVYLYRLQAGEFSEARSMILVK